jgi:DNA-binding NarL/FixJ family response regulator
MKTLLVDDHALLRETLATVMSQTWPALALLQAGNLADAVAVCDAHPDLRLVLVDLGLPDAQGLHGLRTLREHAPDARHVVISAQDDPQTVLDAIEAGAVGFIPKTTEFQTLRHALDLVLQGGVYLPPSVATPGAAMAAEPAMALSPRQLDVLGLLVEGHSNKVISRRLDLSASTVKTHVEAIFRRLAVSSRTQAVVAVARLGLRLPA